MQYSWVSNGRVRRCDGHILQTGHHQDWNNGLSGVSPGEKHITCLCAVLTTYRYNTIKYTSQKGLAAPRGTFSSSQAPPILEFSPKPRQEAPVFRHGEEWRVSHCPVRGAVLRERLNSP